MISMPQVHSIRLQRREGETIAGIARKAGVSRTAAYEKLREGDCSPKMSIKQHKHRVLDDYRTIIEGWLDEELRRNRLRSCPEFFCYGECGNGQQRQGVC